MGRKIAEPASRAFEEMSTHRPERERVLGLLGIFLGVALGVPANAAPLGDFSDHQDVGSPKLPGSAIYNAASQDYTVNAAGHNMWAGRDEFHFLWKRLEGDFILQARVEFVGKGVDPHRKLGWMVRSALDPDAAYADATVHGDGLTSLQFRRTKGAITEQVKSAATAPDFLQFERRGRDYLFSAAKFGEPFATCQTNLDLGENVYIGLFLCSHNSNVVEQAVFRDVRVIRPAKVGFVPYRDYIGSQLEILDVVTGHRQLVFRSSKPFEAPNWTPDGTALIYNTSGRDPGHRGHLHRFELATHADTVIPTDPAIRNNNDHVISFDGTMLGLSHHAAELGGQSAVYTVPINGGRPKLITPLAPSYLHGWSPDGKWLVYTGGRSNEYDIFKRATDGTGEEIQLTTAKGLDDGPEFTPDGRFIYFNSARGGSMQLWRMKPDGADQEQVTKDAGNNWFPHASPDGNWIAFLTFPPSVPPTDHPYYQHITLRVMPVGGGEPRIVAYIYGGQGTLNVPSWAPDSRRLAFVSNSD